MRKYIVASIDVDSRNYLHLEERLNEGYETIHSLGTPNKAFFILRKKDKPIQTAPIRVVKNKNPTQEKESDENPELLGTKSDIAVDIGFKDATNE